jgi:hypothetical protein
MPQGGSALWYLQLTSGDGDTVTVVVADDRLVLQ